MASDKKFSIEELEHRLRLKELEVKSILEITEAINNNLPASSLFKIFEFILQAQIGIKKVALFAKEDNWECVSHFGFRFNIGIEEIKPILLKFKQQQSLHAAHHPFINQFEYIIPIKRKKEIIATILVDGVKGSGDSVDGNLGFIQTITNIIIVAIENKRLFEKQLAQETIKKELDVAAKMQALLIPSKLPKSDFIKMAALYQPHHNVGGDYYDVIELNKNEISFCIADVSGKGMPAALLMANFQASQRALTRRNYELDNIVKMLNERVCEITQGEKFITLFLARYNYKTQKLYYVNAGHNPPVLFSNNKTHFLTEGCTLIGVFEELPEVKMGFIKVETGDVLINYTDGLTELENEAGEQLGPNNLAQFLVDNNKQELEELNKNLLAYLEYFKGKQPFNDDVTVLTCRF